MKARTSLNIHYPMLSPKSSMVSKSTITIFVLVFAALGLLLGFAESFNVNDTDAGGSGSFAKYRFDPGSLEIDPIDSGDDSSD
jgi:hypothetical protein